MAEEKAHMVALLIPIPLLTVIDEQSKLRGMNRSAMIRFCCYDFLQREAYLTKEDIYGVEDEQPIEESAQ